MGRDPRWAVPHRRADFCRRRRPPRDRIQGVHHACLRAEWRRQRAADHAHPAAEARAGGTPRPHLPRRGEPRVQDGHARRGERTSRGPAPQVVRRGAQGARGARGLRGPAALSVGRGLLRREAQGGEVLVRRRGRASVPPSRRRAQGPLRRRVAALRRVGGRAQARRRRRAGVERARAPLRAAARRRAHRVRLPRPLRSR
mmetsp:Transcript_882/g.1754  ORF Transcript_882/g.1754 Transcript_882/m.1754 type:complete len:200 (+) Transcript_882:871-1470(+)